MIKTEKEVSIQQLSEWMTSLAFGLLGAERKSPKSFANSKKLLNVDSLDS